MSSCKIIKTKTINLLTYKRHFKMLGRVSGRNMITKIFFMINYVITIVDHDLLLVTCHTDTMHVI